MGNDLPRQPFSRVFFRRTVSLASVPDTAPLRLTADSRYLLVINGTEVGRGPIRSQPRRLRYDEYDVAPHLVAGDNTIAVLVSYFGKPNAFWHPAVSNGLVGLDAALVLEAKLGDTLLISDDQWRIQRSKAWSVFETESIDGVPIESVDARELPADWAGATFDDQHWNQARIIKTSHIGGFAQSRPPTDPYGALLPRGISMMVGETVTPTNVVDHSVRRRPDHWAGEIPAERVSQLLRESPQGDVAGSLPATAQLNQAEALHLCLDFGRIVAGYVEVDLELPAGAMVDLYYREISWAAGQIGILSPNTSAQYVARGEDDRYRGIEINGLRYLHLMINCDDPATVTVSGVRVRESHYPQVGGAYFRSSDPELDALYRAGIQTVQQNAFDAFTDCPTREQRAWVGDGVVHQLVHLTTNEDWGLARNYVRLSNSPRSDGMLPMSVAGDIEYGGSVTIPDWALHWVHGVFNLYRYVGDPAEVAEYLPTVERVLRWYQAYLDERGTIADVTEWNLVDWASVFSTGRSSILTALWARALTEFAEMSDWLGNAGSAAWARALHEAAKAGFEDFWDPRRGLYVDHLIDGEQRLAASQAAGAAAIVSGLVPPERVRALAETITEESRLVVRSWIGGDGGYDHDKMLDQARGVQTIDWDAESEIVIAEPFFSYVVHEAVAAAGLADRLPQLIRRWSQFLVDGYDTFGECWGWGTPVHGWSSTPTRDLVSHIAGIQPAAPGYAAARIAPALGAIERIEVATPTPYGLIEVKIDGSEVSVNSPVPFVLVAADGTEAQYLAGSHQGLRS